VTEVLINSALQLVLLLLVAPLVSGTIKTTGIEGTVAHVHLAEPGKNGPPIISLTKTADNTWSVPEGAKLTDEQYKSFKEGNLYVNVHSAEHKGGEIRAQIKP